MVNERKRLLLELDRDTVDRPAGSLEDEHGTRCDFVGWIGLAAAITRLWGPEKLPDHKEPR